MRRFLIVSLLRGLSILPLPVVHALGHAVGLGLALLPNRLRAVTRRNLELCFPELDRRDRRRLARASLVESARTLLEAGALWLRPGEKALRLIRRVEGAELVAHAREQGRGVILATPHLGSWEAAGLYGAAQFGMTCLYRPLRVPELEDLVRGARGRLGACYVPANRGGLRALRRALQAGGTVALLPDQEAGEGAGVFARFFHHPAWTVTLPGRLARSSGAVVVLAWCRREPRGRGYTLYFAPAPPGIDDADPAIAARAMNRAVEGLVRQCPEQYQWGYRRFRTRPPGEAPLYS